MTIHTMSMTGLGLLSLLLPLAAQEAGKQATESGDRAAQELGESLQPLSEAFAAQEAKKQDSLRRLIHELDSGTASRGGSAYKAYNSLRSLGSLMVPSLLAELDGMGPFGLMNASNLLASFPDESLGGLVERYLKDPSPARQEMAAGLLSKLAPEVRRKLYPLALASKRDKVRLDGLHVMIGVGSSRDAVMSKISRIYEEGRTPTRTSLMYVLREHDYTRNPKGRQLLEQAMKDPDSRLRRAAYDVFIVQAKDEDEPAALAMVAKMDDQDRESFASSVFGFNRKWPGVLMLGLGSEEVRSQMPNFLNRNGIRLSSEQIESLLLAKDLNLARFGLERLGIRKELVPRMKPLLTLMDHPDSWIRQQASRLLIDHGPLLVLEGGRLADIGRGTRNYAQQIAILERATRGHWSKEMFELWNQIEQSEREVPGWNPGGDKSNLANLMARKVTAQDWPLVEDFLRQAWQDPRVGQDQRRSPYYPRWKAVQVMWNAGYLGRDLQTKALAVVGATTEKIAMLIFDQIGEALVPGEERPDLEAALFQLIAAARKDERDVSRVQKRHGYPRGEILDSAFSLLGRLPGSDRDAELLSYIGDPDLEVASGASTALLARSKDRRAVYAAILESPHAQSLIMARMRDPLLAQDPKLRESIIGLLSNGLRTNWRQDQLAGFLGNLEEADRRELVRSLLTKGRKDLPWTTSIVLLGVLGDFKDPQYLPIYSLYLGDSKPEVRRHAILSIGRTFSPKAAPLLLEALKDDIAMNTSEAKAYLERIDEYLQARAKWTQRFGVKMPTTPEPSGPGRPKK